MQELLASKTNETDIDSIDDSVSYNEVIGQEEIIENMQENDEEAVEIPVEMLQTTADQKKSINRGRCDGTNGNFRPRTMHHTIHPQTFMRIWRRFYSSLH